MGLVFLIIKSLFLIASIILSIFISAYVMVVSDKKWISFLAGILCSTVGILISGFSYKIFFILIFIGILIYFNLQLVEKSQLHRQYQQKKKSSRF